MKTVEAHSHFVTTMAWGRATVGGGTQPNGTTPGAAAEEEKRVNVLATGSVDQTIKVWTP